MVELLAPARDWQVGKTAIDSGADAVYIGAPHFSARQAAGNSISDIDRLCRYAHRFNAKVLVALNTILTDDELPVAQDIIRQLYDIGVDAFIIQDMGLLTLDLPPIRLHASTQCDNRTPDKVRFLEQAGFRRVVLARELSLEQIREIRQQTSLELEAFVHGALCVSYSGQCYLSQALMGRSANRGACAQMCRQRYDLLDGQGNVLMRDKHLLSLQDMDRSMYVRQLAEAGVTTLKIEGRLKDADYVKNITAYYRQIIDNLQIPRTSWGRTALTFTPDPQKTFHRGATDYFLCGERSTEMANFDTPKSTGQYVGTVLRTGNAPRPYIDIATDARLHNGDGFAAGNIGFRATEVCRMPDAVRIITETQQTLKHGERVFRNYDIDFQRQLSDPASAVRTLRLDFAFTSDARQSVLTATQKDSGVKAEIRMEPSQTADNKERMENMLLTQLAKLGGTMFHCGDITFSCTAMPLLKASEINELRRQLVEMITNKIDALSRRDESATDNLTVGTCRGENSSPLDEDVPVGTHRGVSENSLRPLSGRCRIAAEGVYSDYRLNVHNSAARSWYAGRGIDVTQPAFEDMPQAGAELMRCKYCLRYELGICHRQDPSQKSTPLYIRTAGNTLKLSFDCRNCEMVITK